MKKYILISIAGIIGISFLGCSAKKVAINAQLPAEVDTLTKRKNIAVLPFKNDNVNFSGRIETKLASVRINGKPVFNVINRDKIKYILKELKFQTSDLVGNKVAQFGKLAGAKVIITGNVKTTKTNGSYQKPEEVCGAYNKKGHCLYTKTVYITCRTSNATFNASINAIDVNTAQIVDAVNITKNYKADSCKNRHFKTADIALNELVDEAANEYVNRVAPHYITLNVELIDKVKSIDLNNKEEKMFENALTYIDHGRIKKAEYILKRLNEQTREQSYEIAYDLGVVEEALGKLDEAKAAYQLADKIITDNGIEPNELVDKAIERINILIEKRKKLQQQI
jgi:curli biogenesis system outer membrane secretion channel CsgG